MDERENLLLFAGSSHLELAEQIAKHLGKSLGKVKIEIFPDKEIGVQILENVRGRDVFVLQSIARRPNHYLMELLILIDAFKRASARSISAVIPYFGYCRQDRRDKARVPITAKLVANLLEKAGVDRVLTMDLHTDQVEGFFDIPVDNLLARPVLIQQVKKLKLDDYVVVAPDLGSMKLAQRFAADAKKDVAVVDKRRVNAEHVEANALVGAVKGKDVLLIDDMTSTGITLSMAAKVCQKAGAKRVFAAVTHNLLNKAFEESAIVKLLACDTVPLPASFDRSKIEEVSVASLFAEAIVSMTSAKSISSLY